MGARTKILLVLVFLAVVMASFAADHWYGQAARLRVFGVGALMMAGYLASNSSLPVKVGGLYSTTLTGWQKSWVVVPLLIFGAAVACFPHEVACAIGFRGYKCT